MLIIPAIDLKEGKCVRLLRGEEGTETVFSQDPLAVARKWEECGAKRIHVVDLDGAFSGKPRNFELIKEIVNSVSCSVQIGGGIRDIETIERYLETGLDRVILGTVAVQKPEILAEANRKFPQRVAVGIDTKNGRIAVRGWKQTIDFDLKSFLDYLKSAGVSLVIHTDIDRDGTLEGMNINAVEEFVRNSPIPIIASGGISSLNELEKLSNLTTVGLLGVILGKSIYSGKIDLRDAINRFSDY
jgi:phosphoribosylformimino-5-aminoimidazole carboxamide ribotide isomerase